MMGPEGDGKREEGGVPENFLCCRSNPRKRPLMMSSSLYTAQSPDLYYTQYCALARPGQASLSGFGAIDGIASDSTT